MDGKGQGATVFAALAVATACLSTACMSAPPPDSGNSSRFGSEEQPTPTLRRPDDIQESPARLTGDERAGCDGIAEDGECDGDVLVRCNTLLGVPSRRDCEDLGGECVEDSDDGARCEGTDDDGTSSSGSRDDSSSRGDTRESGDSIPGCGDVTLAGSCGGRENNVAIYCQEGRDGGEVIEWDCGLTGADCQVDGCLEGGAFCCDAGSRPVTGTPTETCEDDEFECSPGACIPERLVCNGRIDCDNESVRSDEEGCPDQTCSAGNLPCGNGSCVPEDWFCDGTPDCSNGADEDDCPPGSGGSGSGDTSGGCDDDEFECSPGACIPMSWRCNGRIECDNESVNSDEANCPGQMCLSGNRACDNGSCIPADWFCDDAPDCADGSDERGCP